MRLFNLSLILLFAAPLIVSAQIVITEIMYDLEGSDSGREWIEIYNSESDPVDFSAWKFFENGTNHGLTLYQGSEVIEPSSAVIISDNPTKFLADNPGFGGTIYDSSFSLSNSGETLIIRNDLLEDVDSVSYLSDWGGAGDGNSLSLVGGAWVGGVSTAGVYGNGTEEIKSSEESGPVSNGGGGGPTVNFPIGKISTKIISEKTILSGADTFFEAESFGVEREPLENARHVWSFGDGSIVEGEKVLHNYIYPGEYIVFLDVSSESFGASDKFYVEVAPSSLSIVSAEAPFIRISNSSGKEINISRWILQAGKNFFSIPKNTYIKSNGAITFSNEITKLNGLNRPVNLLYPNGRKAYEFNENQVAEVFAPEVKKPTINTENKEVFKVQEEKEVSIINLAAAAAFSDIDTPNSDEVVGEGKSNILRWLVLLGALILVSVFAIFSFEGRKNKVEGFTIIE